LLLATGRKAHKAKGTKVASFAFACIVKSKGAVVTSKGAKSKAKGQSQAKEGKRQQAAGS
jgi:hypothetical protein